MDKLKKQEVSMNKDKKDYGKNLNIFYLSIITMVMIGLIVGIILFRFYMLGFRNTNDEKVYDQYYVLITDDPKASLWQSIYQGAYLEAQEKNILVDLLGENLGVNYSCVDLMDIAISSDVDGIMVYADESDEMKERIDLASQMGIPVVTLFNDCTLSKRCSYVGISGYDLGKEYGKKVLDVLKDKSDLNNHPLNIVVLSDAKKEDAQLSVIVSGLKEAVADEYDDNSVINVSFANVDNTNAFSAEESIRDIFMSGEVPDIVLCLNELNTTCVYQAVVDYNMVGQVNILGYYDSDIILQAIDHDVITATASIDTYQMGELSVNALEEYNELGYTSQYSPANVTIIDSENISRYYKGGAANE